MRGAWPSVHEWGRKGWPWSPRSDKRLYNAGQHADLFFSVYYVHWYPRVYVRYADPSQQPFQDPRVLPQWAVDNYVNLVPGESRCC